MVELTLSNARGFFCLILMLLSASLSAPAAAEPCDPETAKWNPEHYYPEDAVVFHKGHWYESREMHKGLEPGITFDWIKLDSVPDCSNRPDSGKRAKGSDKQNDGQPGLNQADGKSHRGETATGMCVRPEQWLFSKSYEKGDLASHGGQIWEATGPTRGDMPDMDEPPHWKLVEEHCALQNQ
ncbi:carbohydrate-binding protein [Marinobacter adhaerens]|jgi:hypothetical protein|uniref:carbohydrate-binding protein n=1 Tax=Marinobacter adhaerens TaxID=1033846 RepID=UPI003BAC7B59